MSRTVLDHPLFGLWAEVNRISDTTEDRHQIRSLIAESGIEAAVHVGQPKEFFEGHPLRIAEWVLGQWRHMIEADSSFLNSARNISHHQYSLIATSVRSVESGGQG